MERRLLARGADSGRSDDNLEAIRKRFVTHRESTLPVIAHFEKLGKVYTVDSDRAPGVVFSDVRKCFKASGKYAFGAGGGDVEGGSGEGLLALYEASDGFRGTYDEVLAHEAKFGAANA
jgi:hypothetical protein